MRNEAADAGYVLKIVKNAAKVAVIWVLSTMFAIVLNHMGVRIENLLLLYVVGVVICSVQTSSMCWGIGSKLRDLAADLYHCCIYRGVADG